MHIDSLSFCESNKVGGVYHAVVVVAIASSCS